MYISGLHCTADYSDEDIETQLNARYNLDGNGNGDGDGDGDYEDCSSTSINILWAGPGSTLIKRDHQGSCRGFAFLTFYSAEGASMIVDRINSRAEVEAEVEASETSKSVLPLQLRAELSNPKGGKKGKSKQQKDSNLPDVRLRRQRRAPIRKHPVIVSSDGKRTNLGNKTR